MDQDKYVRDLEEALVAAWGIGAKTYLPTPAGMVRLGGTVAKVAAARPELVALYLTPALDHDAHTVGGPANCPRCTLLRENADWMVPRVVPQEEAASRG